MPHELPLNFPPVLNPHSAAWVIVVVFPELIIYSRIYPGRSSLLLSSVLACFPLLPSLPSLESKRICSFFLSLFFLFFFFFFFCFCSANVRSCDQE
ncbi:hypothetical protein BDV28DRAFT_134946 [Aspergillus coremiiformis]|uniref:Uncharacterized protein n=1 Tax=Aspergillus coremiiformis TaxID=138285 RepID=A0A5N6Z564_9EURO|nr:hypothetical protein BDV28DRAFT_134946 [Aspergillus coremiiformis]